MAVFVDRYIEIRPEIEMDVNSMYAQCHSFGAMETYRQEPHYALRCDACGKVVKALCKAPHQSEESWVCMDCLVGQYGIAMANHVLWKDIHDFSKRGIDT